MKTMEKIIDQQKNRINLPNSNINILICSDIHIKIMQDSMSCGEIGLNYKTKLLILVYC